jgi:hypothetical protein
VTFVLPPEFPQAVPVVATVRLIGPEAPAVNVIVRVPWPPVIVPFVMPQVYVTPTPRSGTEAVLPTESEQTVEAVVIGIGGGAGQLTVSE